MRADLALPVGPRLAKPIPLLASNHEGEVIATARAIGRVLATNGLDWHAVAAAVTGPSSGVQVAHPSWAAMSRSQRLDTLDRLLGSNGLTAWERAFCDSIRAAMHLWPRSEQSVKQRAVLDGLIGEVLS